MPQPIAAFLNQHITELERTTNPRLLKPLTATILALARMTDPKRNKVKNVPAEATAVLKAVARDLGWRP